MKYKEIGLNNSDAQFIEARKFQVTEIARMFRVPPHMIADLDRATFSNIEHQSLEFVLHTMTPWAERWESSIETNLLTESEADLEIEFDFTSLLRGDHNARAAYYGSGITNGWMTRNEARLMEGYDPIAGLDMPLQQLNMAPAGSNPMNKAPKQEDANGPIPPDARHLALVNAVDVKPFAYYADVATANAAGYALHRAFYNGGAIRPGFFVDKYYCSKNASGIASSIKNGIPLASALRGGIAGTNFASLTGAPADAFYGSIAAAKTRGASFFPMARYQRAALALLANAHGSAASGTTYCAWYSAGSTNFPKGCNNNALGDANDGMLAFLDDGTATNCCKTGSANFFSKTTHNGQNCGVADLNGTVWGIEPFGLTSNGVNFYLLNTAVDVTTITAGNTLATDCWGATGLAAMYTSLGATYESLTASSTNKTFGAAAQVLSAATSGNGWLFADNGFPLVAGVGGSNQFGNDYMLDYRTNECCVNSGGSWGSGAVAGVWAVDLSNGRGNSFSGYGFRSASYL